MLRLGIVLNLEMDSQTSAKLQIRHAVNVEEVPLERDQDPLHLPIHPFIQPPVHQQSHQRNRPLSHLLVCRQILPQLAQAHPSA